MLVLLNQIDRVPAADQEPTLHDVRRLLRADGLVDVPVLGTSAARGDGVDELKRMLAKRVKDKASATQRMSLDVTSAAERLRQINGGEPAPGITGQRRAALEEALARSAGVPVWSTPWNDRYVSAGSERRPGRRCGCSASSARTRWPTCTYRGGVALIAADPESRPALPRGHRRARARRRSIPRPHPAVEGVGDLGGHRSQADLSDALDRAVAGTDLRIPREAVVGAGVRARCRRWP
jgi:hypothetical protein